MVLIGTERDKLKRLFVGSNPVGHTIEIPTPTGMGISQSVEKAALPLLIDMHETIVAERW